MDASPDDPSLPARPRTTNSRGRKRRRESTLEQQSNIQPTVPQQRLEEPIVTPEERPQFQAAEPQETPTAKTVSNVQQPSTPSPYLTVKMARHTAPPPDSSSARTPQYQLVSPGTTTDPRVLSQNDKDQLIRSLRTHRVNTITELRRIEKIFAYLASSEVTEPMTAAWAHYVNSNNLLNELRGLTKNYPFSSECLDEAKTLVVRDPQSIRSWNYCWLVLLKMEKEGLIVKHARALASNPAMWGGRSPTAEGVERLASACIAEWTTALRQMLRHWDRPPSTTGH